MIPDDSYNFKPYFGKLLKIGVDAPTYEGATTVTPSLTTQTLNTNGKLMTDNVTVQAMPLGSATTPNTTITPTVTMSFEDGKAIATVTGSKAIAPTVNEGYVTRGTYGTVSVSGTGEIELPSGSNAESLNFVGTGAIDASTSTAESFNITVPNLSSVYRGVTFFVTNFFRHSTTIPSSFTINVNESGDKGVFSNYKLTHRVADFQLNDTWMLVYDDEDYGGTIEGREDGGWILYKGGSENNFTNDLLTKLNGIEAGAEKNVYQSISVNHVYQTPSVSRGIDIIVPTKTSDLTNDSNFPVDASYVHTDNNFTTTLKNKLDAIESGAEVNVIETVKVNGAALTPTDGAVDVLVPIQTVKVNGTALTPNASGAVNVVTPVNDIKNYLGDGTTESLIYNHEGTIPRASYTDYGTVRLYTILASEGKYAFLQGVSTSYSVPILDSDKHLDPSVIGDLSASGVTAGTYGQGYYTSATSVLVPWFTVGADGRITGANYSTVPAIETKGTSIAAGNTTISVAINRNFSTASNHWVDVKGYTKVTGSKSDKYTPLVYGTDYTYYIEAYAVYITLTSALSEAAYFTVTTNCGTISSM